MNWLLAVEIFTQTFLLLLMGHAVADFALQSDSMGKGKNRNRQVTPPPGQIPATVWPYWLTAHSGVHAAAVYLVTGSLGFAICEWIAHWTIDFFKCENKLTVHQDQALHILCKAIWAAAPIFIAAYQLTGSS